MKRGKKMKNMRTSLLSALLSVAILCRWGGETEEHRMTNGVEE